MTEAFDAYALPDNPRLYPTGHTEGERIEESYVKRGEGNSQGVEIGMRHTRIYPEPQSVDGRNVLGTITDINAAGDVRQVNLILGDNDSVTPDYQRRYKGDDPNAQEITKALYADLDASVAIPSQPSAPAPSNSAS